MNTIPSATNRIRINLISSLGAIRKSEIRNQNWSTLMVPISFCTFVQFHGDNYMQLQKLFETNIRWKQNSDVTVILFKGPSHGISHHDIIEMLTADWLVAVWAKAAVWDWYNVLSWELPVTRSWYKYWEGIMLLKRSFKFIPSSVSRKQTCRFRFFADKSVNFA